MADEAGGSVGDDGSTAALFALAIESEERARGIYDVLRDRFAHVPEATELWGLLMQDEEQHLRQLERMRDALTPEQLVEPADEVSLARARAVNASPVEKRLAAVRTLDDAYELAHEIEHAEVNRVFAALASQFIPRAERRAFYLAKLQEHAGRLTVFAARTGGTEWRRAIRVQGDEPRPAS